MRIRSSFAFTGLTTFFVLLFMGLTSNSLADPQNPCLACHVKFEKPLKYVHPALKMGCAVCHEPVQGKQHPGDRDSMKLRYDLPALCYTCHEEAGFNGGDVHAPVAKGMCTACHNVHQSELKGLLISDRPDLCFKCHERTKFTKKYNHPVALNACGSRCHNAHSSKNPFLLSGPVNEVCAGCHSPQQTGSHIVSVPGGYIHPVRGMPDPSKRGKELNCVSCHNPHGSNFVKFFASGKKCRRCHKFY
jgi:predicted CXXCH cytochrome family protein